MADNNGTTVVDNGTTTEGNPVTVTTPKGKPKAKPVSGTGTWTRLYGLVAKMPTRATTLKRVLPEGTVTVRVDGLPSSYGVDALAGLASAAGVKGRMTPNESAGQATIGHTFAADGDRAADFVRGMAE